MDGVDTAGCPLLPAHWKEVCEEELCRIVTAFAISK